MNQLSLFRDEKEPPTDDSLWTDDGLPAGVPDEPVHIRRRKLEGTFEPEPKPGPKFVAFDLEIAQPFEMGRPYGISCAATMTYDGPSILWYGAEKAPGATLPERMNPQEVQEMTGYLLEMQSQGYTVVTFNGAGFDLDVLAEECYNEHWKQDVARLTMEHIDIAFEMHCQMGYMTGLAKLSEGLGVGGKTEGMHGDLAPIVWSGWPADWSDDLDENATRMRAEIEALGVEVGTREAQDLCLEYVGQDAKLTADVYTALLEQGHVYWTTQRGTRSRYPWRPEQKDGRLLTVNESLLLPEPDTSWMSKPRLRSDVLAWMEAVK